MAIHLTFWRFSLHFEPACFSLFSPLSFLYPNLILQRIQSPFQIIQRRNRADLPFLLKSFLQETRLALLGLRFYPLLVSLQGYFLPLSQVGMITSVPRVAAQGLLRLPAIEEAETLD